MSNTLANRIERSETAAQTAPRGRAFSWTLLATVLFFVASCVLVSPFEKYPVNDEHTYGTGVLNLLTTGKLLYPSTTAHGLPQTYLSIPLCDVFGFSYGLLRAEVLFIALFGICGAYLMARQLGLSRNASGAIAFVFASNPFFLCYANTFQTDIPNLAFIVWMLAFLARSIKKDGSVDWLISGLFFGLAILSRQSSILLVLPFAFMIGSLAIRKRKVLYPIVSLIGFPLLCYFYVAETRKTCLMVTKQSGEYEQIFAAKFFELFQFASPDGLWQIWTSSAIALTYLALFSIPIIGALLPGAIAKLRSRTNIACAIFALLFISIPLFYVVAVQGRTMPFSPNVFDPPFLGAYCVTGHQLWNLDWRKWTTVVAVAAAVPLTGMLAASAFTIFRAATKKSKSRLAPRQNLLVHMGAFLLAALVIITLFIVVQTSIYCFDKYYMQLLPFSLPLLCLLWRHASTPHQNALCVSLCLIVGTLGTIQAVDNHNFCKARDRTIDKLLSLGIDAGSIDGGSEFNFLTTPNLHLAHSSTGTFEPSSKGSDATRNLRWWPINSEEYIVTTRRKLDGYVVIDKTRYFSPLKGRNQTMYALKRVSR